MEPEGIHHSLLERIRQRWQGIQAPSSVAQLMTYTGEMQLFILQECLLRGQPPVLGYHAFDVRGPQSWRFLLLQRFAAGHLARALPAQSPCNAILVSDQNSTSALAYLYRTLARELQRIVMARAPSAPLDLQALLCRKAIHRLDAHWRRQLHTFQATSAEARRFVHTYEAALREAVQALFSS